MRLFVDLSHTQSAAEIEQASCTSLPSTHPPLHPSIYLFIDLHSLVDSNLTLIETVAQQLAPPCRSMLQVVGEKPNEKIEVTNTNTQTQTHRHPPHTHTTAHLHTNTNAILKFYNLSS